MDSAAIRLDTRRSKAADGTSFELIILFLVNKLLNMYYIAIDPGGSWSRVVLRAILP